MPVFSIIKQDISNGTIIQEQFNLEKYGIFQRGTIKDLIKATIRGIASNLPKDGQLREVRERIRKDEQFKIIFQVRNFSRIFVITDIDYDSKIAYRLLEKCFKEGASLEELIKEYKNWEDKDQFKKIEEELEKCNVVVLEGLAQVLKRGETLENLLEKSNHLSLQTKLLFKTAKKKNSCC